MKYHLLPSRHIWRVLDDHRSAYERTNPYWQKVHYIWDRVLIELRIKLPARLQLFDLYHIRIISYILGKNDALD